MAAGAPIGNKNAEKWTEQDAIDLLNEAIKLSHETEGTTLKSGEKVVEVVSYRFDFIGEIARELGTYHQMMTQHLPSRFESIKPLLKQLINNLEANCYVNTKKGNIKEAIGIVNLKSNHKWTDRTDLTSKDEKLPTPIFPDVQTDECN